MVFLVCCQNSSHSSFFMVIFSRTEYLKLDAEFCLVTDLRDLLFGSCTSRCFISLAHFEWAKLFWNVHPSACTASEENQLLKPADLKLFMTIWQQRIYLIFCAGFEVVSNVDSYFSFLLCAERLELSKHNSLNENSVLITFRKFTLSVFVIIFMAKKT